MGEDHVDYKALYDEQKLQVSELQARLDELTVCRRCGMPVDDKPLSLTDDVKKEYFRTLLTNKPFRKEYDLFDGVVTVVFEVSKGALLTAQRAAMNNADIRVMHTINDIVLLSNLVSIATYDETVEERKFLYEKDVNARIKALEDIEGSLNELENSVDYVLLACVRRVLDEFGILVKTLADAGLDANFYKGDGLVSP